MRLRGQRIRELLLGRNMSVVNLAIAVGVSPSHMCNVLNGRRKLNFLHSKRLIELFGVDAIAKAIDWELMKLKSPLEV